MLVKVVPGWDRIDTVTKKQNMLNICGYSFKIYERY